LQNVMVETHLKRCYKKHTVWGYVYPDLV
jgi:hypothetical protein